jgi:hypothetical protein
MAEKGKRGAINFRTLRTERKNPHVEMAEVCRLLWKSETINLLLAKGMSDWSARASKEVLYEKICAEMTQKDLVSYIGECFKNRETWRAD